MPGSRAAPVQLLLALGCLALLALVLVPKVAARPVVPTVVQPRITVSIEGAVVSPGLHELEFGARVADLVGLAGGFAPGAARTMVALAAPLTDGQVVQVPALAVAGLAQRVSLNTATLEQLQTLPGVGAATAARVVEQRPYNRIDDLLRVPGIGPKKLERLRPLVAP